MKMKIIKKSDEDHLEYQFGPWNKGMTMNAIVYNEKVRMDIGNQENNVNRA